MYLGARRLTGINTILNLVTYIFTYFLLEIPFDIYFFIFLIFAFVFYYIFNIYSLERGKISGVDYFYSLMLNVIFSIFAVSMLDIKEALLYFLILFFIQNIYKFLFYKFVVRDRNIIIIGKNEKADKLKKLLNEKQMYKVVAEIGCEESEKIDFLLEENSISKVIITEKIEDKKVIDLILQIKLKGIQVFDYLGFVEKVEEKIPVDAIDEEWILYGSGFSILHNGIQNKVKRIIDIFLALFIGIITLPLIILSVVLIKLESKGSVLYTQDRVGLGNKEFRIYKFRSMVNDAEKDGAKWAQENDPRVTNLGKMMRKTRIDELPQLWNVIKGDMSFIGPRPERNIFIQELEKQIPFYNIRHCIKPGLTGWAQVKYPYGASVEDAYQKLQYDLYYIKNQNFIFDIMVFFKTAKIVFFGRGR